VKADPPVLKGGVDAESRRSFPVKLTIDREVVDSSLQMVPFDITLDDRHHGELFDFIIRASPSLP
jgi:hypothetical protein